MTTTDPRICGSTCSTIELLDVSSTINYRNFAIAFHRIMRIKITFQNRQCSRDHVVQLNRQLNEIMATCEPNVQRHV